MRLKKQTREAIEKMGRDGVPREDIAEAAKVTRGTVDAVLGPKATTAPPPALKPKLSKMGQRSVMRRVAKSSPKLRRLVREGKVTVTARYLMPGELAVMARIVKDVSSLAPDSRAWVKGRVDQLVLADAGKG